MLITVIIILVSKQKLGYSKIATINSWKGMRWVYCASDEWLINAVDCWERLSCPSFPKLEAVYKEFPTKKYGLLRFRSMAYLCMLLSLLLLIRLWNGWFHHFHPVGFNIHLEHNSEFGKYSLNKTLHHQCLHKIGFNFWNVMLLCLTFRILTVENMFAFKTYFLLLIF